MSDAAGSGSAEGRRRGSRDRRAPPKYSPTNGSSSGPKKVEEGSAAGRSKKAASKAKSEAASKSRVPTATDPSALVEAARAPKGLLNFRVFPVMVASAILSYLKFCTSLIISPLSRPCFTPCS